MRAIVSMECIRVDSVASELLTVHPKSGTGILLYAAVETTFQSSLFLNMDEAFAFHHGLVGAALRREFQKMDQKISRDKPAPTIDCYLI